MEEEIKLNIKIEINTEINLEETAPTNAWHDAKEEERIIYVKNKIRNHIILNIEDLIDELMEDGKITYQL